MSLILDALRKSEAQRRRGEMPDLRAELPPTTRSVEPRRRWPFWFAGIAAVIAILALAWGVWDRTPAPVPPSVANVATTQDSVELVPAPVDSAAAPVVESTPPPVAPAPLPRTKPLAGSEPEPTQPVADDVYAAASAAYPPPTAQEPTAPPPTTEAPARTGDRYAPAIAAATTPAQRSPAATPAPVAPLPLPPPASGAPVRLADLSPGEREQLPALKISMHMFGPTPAQRFAIIDGTRVGQGDRVGEAVVEEIAADGVVLNWHGRRVALPLR
ncbi:general secretion pathway protein GspB [Lysobacter auxotrophicus]|uniref:General secretion pathway protein GspB n=1 Tax=Lysobacter auxotrophicus TaxID=2992573 RepID=A0ABM8DFP2_9GAMM|nr:general secretion pathway protein GspB [Lysobacter auxotrophicus]BDU17422.1 general secretion pathway protein GspB [Lysobacter auxotrophicus]